MSITEAKLENIKPQNIHDPITILDQDILDRQDTARLILNRLIISNPGAIGIYGGWGTGKTSLLNLLSKLNDKKIIESGRKDIHIEVIDAWKYESGDGLLVPVVVRFKQMADLTDFPEAWRVITRRVLATTALSVTDALLKKYVGLDRKSIREGYEEIEKRDKRKDHAALLLEWEGWSDEVENTAAAFEELVDFVLEKIGCGRIVICVDNLDRCSPENVVHLLESVKNFFSVPNCTWVFAMDAEVIANYINHKYEGARMDGNSYLDKIIPEQYHLSLSSGIDHVKIVNLLRFAAGTDRLELDERNIPQLPRVLVPRRLIKSAAKLAEFYRLPNRDMTKISKPLVFNLALLYHAWPGFYQRFSSDSEMHIRGILDNFFPPETASQVKEAPTITGDKLLPLLKDYVEDQDLSYFIKTAFGEYPNHRATFTIQLIDGIRGLRETGLP